MPSETTTNPAGPKHEDTAFRLGSGAGAALVTLATSILLIAIYLIAGYVASSPKSPSVVPQTDSTADVSQNAATAGPAAGTQGDPPAHIENEESKNNRRMEAQARAAVVEGAFRQSMDEARRLSSAKDFAGATKALDHATVVISKDMVALSPESVPKSTEEVRSMRLVIEDAKATEAAHKAEAAAREHEQLVDRLIAESGGRLTEVSPLENASSLKLAPSAVLAPFRALVESRCKTRILDTAVTPTAELVARQADVRVLAVRVTGAAVRYPPASYGDGTPFVVIDASLIVTVKRASTGESLWSREITDSKTRLAEEVKGQAPATLAEYLITSLLDSITKDQDFQAAF